ncbi:MAG: allophanate hydrolase [Hyphomicrobium sp.]|jgi:allophanate hydrolase
MILSLDIASLSATYDSGTLKPQDVIGEVYARIRARGERPVWITLASEDVACERARTAPRGPLYGIPFAVKDNIDVAGLPTTCACPEFAYTPDRSATVIERLEAAGAVLIGKTNMDQFATGLVGTRTPYGIASSVFSDKHISGGSSSGSAVAVAAGLVSFSLGTDTAGSGRVPAGFNNIVGLKPTKGLISTRGVVPACRTQDVVSIFAGTVGDAHKVLGAAAAFDAEDAYSRVPARPTAPEALRKGFRFGVPAEGPDFLGDDAASAIFDEAVKRLEALGGERVDIDFVPFREAARLLYEGPWVAERLAAIEEFARARPEAINDVVRGIICGADKIDTVSAFKAFYRLAALTRAADRVWAEMDVMLLPTSGTIYTIADVLADPVRLNSNLGLTTNFVNLMDLSALAVPAGFRANGLPFGVTLVGRAFEDGKLATIGDALHRALPGANIGGTEVPLPEASRVSPKTVAEGYRVAVVGAHLRGQPLNGQLVERKARLIETTRTAPGYSFYALPGTVPPKPGLVFDGTGRGGIEVEIWEMDAAGFGSFVGLIPSPLGIGTVQLADGSGVKGFLCEAHAIAGAEDITAFGGWRAWLASK